MCLSPTNREDPGVASPFAGFPPRNVRPQPDNGQVHCALLLEIAFHQSEGCCTARQCLARKPIQRASPWPDPWNRALKLRPGLVRSSMNSGRFPVRPSHLRRLGFKMGSGFQPCPFTCTPLLNIHTTPTTWFRRLAPLFDAPRDCSTSRRCLWILCWCDGQSERCRSALTAFIVRGGVRRLLDPSFPPYVRRSRVPKPIKVAAHGFNKVESRPARVNMGGRRTQQWFDLSPALTWASHHVSG